jgi:hypothetical protein
MPPEAYSLKTVFDGWNTYNTSIVYAVARWRKSSCSSGPRPACAPWARLPAISAWTALTGSSAWMRPAAPLLAK